MTQDWFKDRVGKTIIISLPNKKIEQPIREADIDYLVDLSSRYEITQKPEVHRKEFAVCFACEG